MAKRPITIQLEPDLIEEIDQAAQHSGASRQEWIAAACRGALGPVAEVRPYRLSVPGPNVENVRSSAQAKRNVEPRPKKGKP